MRYEPANAKFFETEVRWKSLCAALKLLGCFEPSKTQFEPRTNSDFVKRGFDVFEKFFCNLNDAFVELDENNSDNINSSTNAAANSVFGRQEINEKLVYICYILRYLYDTAIDSFDK